MKSATRTSPASTVSSTAHGRGRGNGTPSWLLSVDPGLSGTGCVLWKNGVPKAAKVFRPLAGASDLVSRAKHVASVIERWRAEFMPVLAPLTVVIEFPEYQESLKGRTARTTGSIDKLSFLIGVMAGVWPAAWDIHLPKVREWKGQLPKQVVVNRMLGHYGSYNCSLLGVKSHAWDALGIGHWFLHQRKEK